MTNTKHTKKALTASLLSMLLCIAMLIGSTFAWFTDTASTSVNRIQSGKLDIELQMKDAEGKWVSAEGKTIGWKTDDNRAQDKILWEPGATYELQDLKLVNKSNLALKYKVEITGIQGDAELNDVIDWTIKLGDDEEFAVGKEMTWLPSDESMEKTFTIKGHMQETAGNDYQDKKIEGIAITVYATQYTHENDSYTDQYDKDALYGLAVQRFDRAGEYTLNYQIIAENENEFAVTAIGENVTVTIEDGYYSGKGAGIVAAGGATVNINGGKFTAEGEGTSVIYAARVGTDGTVGGNINIYGGEFYAEEPAANGLYYVLNLQNNSNSTIKVYGGSFRDFNPADGDDYHEVSFVADGYVVIADTKKEEGHTWYTVVKGESASTKEDLANLEAGTPEAPAVVVVTDDVDTDNNSTDYWGKPAVELPNYSELNLAGKTIAVTGNGKNGLATAVGATATVSGGTYVYESKISGSRWGAVTVREGSNLTMENMIINASDSAEGYTILLSGASTPHPGGKLILKNCTVNGNIFVGSKAELVLENCTVNGTFDVMVNGKMTATNSFYDNGDMIKDIIR